MVIQRQSSEVVPPAYTCGGASVDLGVYPSITLSEFHLHVVSCFLKGLFPSVFQ